METDYNQFIKLAIHEEIIMQNSDLPINFFLHEYERTGLYCILHWHSELEFVYVKKGAVSVACKDCRKEARAGELVFINPNEPHDYYAIESPVVLYCATVSQSLLQSRFISSYDLRFLPGANNMVYFDNIIRDKDICDAFLKMWEEGQSKDAGYEFALKSYLFSMMSLLVRRHICYTIPQKNYITKCHNLENINKVIEYIAANYQDNLTLEELANILCVNRFYFCRLFKEATGSTPVEYINQFRTHQAIILITEHPEYSITRVATSVGYNDSNYFSRVFKTATGESPTVFRANLVRDAAANDTDHG